jgi:hypothetical protein
MTNNKKQNQQHRSDNFFEAFRELGRQTAKDATSAASGVASDMLSQISSGSRSPQTLSGELTPDQPFDYEKELVKREKEAQKKAQTHFEYQKRQEKLVFSRKQEEIKAQITAIQEELKKLISEAAGLAKEVEVAVEQSVVNPGIYHLNYFDKLRQLLILLRKKVADSRTWMHTVNSRTKRRSYFWGQVQKSGTKFLLSQERYMSTQAG